MPKDDELSLEAFFISLDKENANIYSRLLSNFEGASWNSFAAVLQVLVLWRKRSLSDWVTWTELGASPDSRVVVLDDKKMVWNNDQAAESQKELNFSQKLFSTEHHRFFILQITHGSLSCLGS